jgi:tetratricopeptide (TPR) repeat protein
MHLNNLAAIMYDSNKLAKAKSLVGRALVIDEKALGPCHQRVAQDLGTLGQLLLSTGRFSEAEPYLRRALAISEKNLGPNNPTIAYYLAHLVYLLKATGRHAEAEPILRQEVALWTEFTRTGLASERQLASVAEEYKRLHAGVTKERKLSERKSRR